MKKLIWASLASFQFAFADPAGVTQLNGLLQNFQNLQAHFSETVQNSQGQAAPSQGTLAIQKPNQFNWHVLTPNEEWYISDGHQVWNVEPDLDQVTITPLSRNLSTTPLLLLGGEVQDLSRLFTVTAVDQEDYVLVPKDSQSLIKQITLHFDSTGVIQALDIVNTLGQRSHLQFSQVKLNGVLPASLFHYTIPAGMDVLS